MALEIGAAFLNTAIFDLSDTAGKKRQLRGWSVDSREGNTWQVPGPGFQPWHQKFIKKLFSPHLAFFDTVNQIRFTNGNSPALP